MMSQDDEIRLLTEVWWLVFRTMEMGEVREPERSVDISGISITADEVQEFFPRAKKLTRFEEGKVVWCVYWTWVETGDPTLGGRKGSRTFSFECQPGSYNRYVKDLSILRLYID